MDGTQRSLKSYKLKPVIIPKLELTAAIVAPLIDQVTEEENELPLLLFGNAKKKRKKMRHGHSRPLSPTGFL